MKSLRATYRIVTDLSYDREMVVNLLTDETDVTGVKAQEKLAKLVIKKLQLYIKLRNEKPSALAVGPAVGLERTVPIIKPKRKDPALDVVDDDELIDWLTGENQILRQDEIEQRPQKLDDQNAKQFWSTIEPYLFKQPGRLSEGKLTAHSDNMQRIEDYLRDYNKKVRKALDAKLAQ